MINPGLEVYALKPYGSYQLNRLYWSTALTPFIGLDFTVARRWVVGTQFVYRFEQVLLMSERKQLDGPSQSIPEVSDPHFTLGLQWPELYAFYRF